MRKYKCSYLVQFVFVDNDKDDDRDNQKTMRSQSYVIIWRINILKVAVKTFLSSLSFVEAFFIQHFAVF